MTREDLADLTLLAAVAEEGSFTRAAARLGTSQPALSRTIRALEDRLGVALLARTTRSVAPTAAGADLLASVRPALADMDAALARLQERREQPSGTVRLTMTRQAAACLRPVLPSFLARHPAVQVEVTVDDAFTDIVAGRFDAGIRYGSHVEQDMVAVRIAPDVRVAVVAAPAYLAGRSAPLRPQDLLEHACIGYRLPGGGLYAWEFDEGGRRVHLRLDPRLTLDDGDCIRDAALDGVGIAYLFEDQVEAHLADGCLIRLLEPWCPVQTGYHLYYPSRRQASAALAALSAALRARHAGRLR